MRGANIEQSGVDIGLDRAETTPVGLDRKNTIMISNHAIYLLVGLEIWQIASNYGEAYTVKWRKTMYWVQTVGTNIRRNK